MRMNINKVNFFYGTKQTLFDISMGIATNKVTALIGPSGCGKSTLLRTFNRMHETVRHARLEGEILLDGQNILAQDVTQLRRRIGMVFQRPNPFPKSIFDNVAYGLRVRRLPAATIRARVGQVLELVGLPGYERRFPNQLSGGEQQRVAVARAVVVEPQLLLFDEPLSNLDAKLRVQMRAELSRLQRQLAITTVYVTHDQEEAMAISDRIAVMRQGVIAQVGTAEELPHAALGVRRPVHRPREPRREPRPRRHRWPCGGGSVGRLAERRHR